jgi:hypothetical protein
VNDQLEVLKLVASRLEGEGIRYMVSGSTAMNYYAQPRMTRDIDVVVELVSADVDRMVALFGSDFSCDAEEIRDAIARRRMFNLIHVEHLIKVDMVVRRAPGGTFMNDTSPAVEARFRRLLMQRTGEARLKMGCDLFDSSRSIVSRR